jgi:iron complex outermembrane receptor protein
MWKVFAGVFGMSLLGRSQFMECSMFTDRFGCFRSKVSVVSHIFIVTNLLAGTTFADVNGLTEDDVFGDIPVVTGASHFPQTISDAPTSVSIIDRKMIDASGAVEIVEVFRMVPGFQVYFPHTGRAAINYHGFPQEYSYRMEVKIDGRSVYEPSENAVLWSTLPIELDDVDYIEVIRGANAPADGANATVASVNIVTKTPVASKGWRVRVAAGEQDTQKVSAAYSGLDDNFSYKINGGYRYSSGFDDKDGTDFDDDVESSYLSFRTIVTPNLYDSIDIQFGYSENNIDMADSGRSISVEDILKWDYTSYYLSTHWERQLQNNNAVELVFYYNHADIDAPEVLGLFSDIAGISPEDVPLALPGLEDFNVVFGLYDSYAERSDIEARYTGEFGTNTRYMVGAATRYDRMKSERQFVRAVDVEESSHRLFTNVETKPSEEWTLNAGVIVEYNDIVNDYSSYRLSANYHVSPGHTFRLAYNDGERSPGLYEANQQSGVEEGGYLLDIDTFSPDDLSTEKFESQEVAYYGLLLDDALTLEIKLFKEKSRDLVKYTLANTVEYFGYSDNFDDNFTLRTNSAWVDAEGIETQIKYQPDRRWLVNFQYSYTEHEGRWVRSFNNPKGRSLDDIAPEEMGSLTVGYFFDSGFEASMLWYYQDEVEWEQGDFADDFHRIDMRIAKRMKMSGHDVVLELIGQNVFDEGYTEFHYLNQHESRYMVRAVMGF